MVKRLVGWLVLVPFCALLIVFALANRQFVALNFNPFVSPELLQQPGYGVPLFLVLYVVLLVGVMLGGIATWFAQSQHRQRERHWRREARVLTAELETIRKSQGQNGTTPMAEVDDLLELR